MEYNVMPHLMFGNEEELKDALKAMKQYLTDLKNPEISNEEMVKKMCLEDEGIKKRYLKCFKENRKF